MMNRHAPLIATILLNLLIGANVATGQQMRSQTLPRGYDSTPGNSATNLPFNTTSEQTWQWHYDSTEFDATGPIQIRDLAVRLSAPGDAIAPFDFGGLEVTLIEAITDYRVGSHSTVFENNVLRRETVRAGPFTDDGIPGTAAPTGRWMPLRLERPFSYDPTLGHDFIVELRTCAPSTVFGSLVDGVANAGGGIGGNRYGNMSSCTATAQNFQNDEFVPIVRVSYQEVQTQTLPAGFDGAMAFGASGQPFVSLGDQVWHWHYDSTEFNASAPIAITDVAVRLDFPFSTMNGFAFAGLQLTLAESSSNYTAGNHPSNFADNIQRSRVVRSGPFNGGPVHAGLGATSNWISLQLERAFVYDPSSGNDFLIELRKCGTNQAFTGNIDCLSTAAQGAGGGNRYGNLSNCAATNISTFSFNDFVPIVKIDYVPAAVTMPFAETFDLSPAGGPVAWEQNRDANLFPWIVAEGGAFDSIGAPSEDNTTRLARDGSYLAQFDFAEDASAIIKSPWIEATAGQPFIISYWLHHSSTFPGSSNELRILFEFENSPGFSSTIYKIAPSAGWQFKSHSVLAGSTQRVRMVFDAQTDNFQSSAHHFCIDDFRAFVEAPEGGQVSRPEQILDVNRAISADGFPVGLFREGPYYAEMRPGETADMHFEGAPGQPIFLLGGQLAPAFIDFGPIGRLDLANLDVLADGTRSDFLSSFFRTDSIGSLDVSFPVPPLLGLGVVFDLQALIFTPGPEVVKFTNSVRVTTVP